jgi:SAM-dependent methyltransferase
MQPIIPDEVRIQRERYSRIAPEYERVHADPEHVLALAFLEGMLGYLQAASLLDVGAGTGRTIRHLLRSRPEMRLVGIEPVAELRQVGHHLGVSEDQLRDGNGYELAFRDGEFDVVCEFGVLHHVRDPNRVVAEMLRVARKAIFISDMNNFGGGARPVRLLKQVLHTLGLWKAVNFLKTGGRGYSITAGDGLFYSYSVFDSLPLIDKHCVATHLLNTLPAGPNLYRTSAHVALLGVKQI